MCSHFMNECYSQSSFAASSPFATFLPKGPVETKFRKIHQLSLAINVNKKVYRKAKKPTDKQSGL